MKDLAIGAVVLVLMWGWLLLAIQVEAWLGWVPALLMIGALAYYVRER